MREPGPGDHSTANHAQGVEKLVQARDIGTVHLHTAPHHPPVDHTVLPGVGYHPRHAQRAWRDVVDLLAECLPVTE